MFHDLNVDVSVGYAFINFEDVSKLDAGYVYRNLTVHSHTT